MNNHIFSSTQWIENDLVQLLKQRRADIGRNGSTGKLTLRAAYKHLRRMPKYSLLGDYPIIFCGARVLSSNNARPTRENVLSAMDASKEFKGRFNGKKDLLNQLLLAGN